MKGWLFMTDMMICVQTTKSPSIFSFFKLDITVLLIFSASVCISVSREGRQRKTQIRFAYKRCGNTRLNFDSVEPAELDLLPSWLVYDIYPGFVFDEIGAIRMRTVCSLDSRVSRSHFKSQVFFAPIAASIKSEKNAC